MCVIVSPLGWRQIWSWSVYYVIANIRNEWNHFMYFSFHSIFGPSSHWMSLHESSIRKIISCMICFSRQWRCISLRCLHSSPLKKIPSNNKCFYKFNNMTITIFEILIYFCLHIYNGIQVYLAIYCSNVFLFWYHSIIEANCMFIKSLLISIIT